MAAYLSLAACASAGSQAEGELTGKVWALDSLNGAAPVPGSTVTAEFTEDGKVGDRLVATVILARTLCLAIASNSRSPWLLR